MENPHAANALSQLACSATLTPGHTIANDEEGGKRILLSNLVSLSMTEACIWIY